jgi:hypothetical protein
MLTYADTDTTHNRYADANLYLVTYADTYTAHNRYADPQAIF